MKFLNTKLETEISGYYIEQKKKILDKFYFNAAKLLNCKPEEISFLQYNIWMEFVVNSITIRKTLI